MLIVASNGPKAREPLPYTASISNDELHVGACLVRKLSRTLDEHWRDVDPSHAIPQLRQFDRMPAYAAR